MNRLAKVEYISDFAGSRADGRRSTVGSAQRLIAKVRIGKQQRKTIQENRPIIIDRDGVQLRKVDLLGKRKADEIELGTLVMGCLCEASFVVSYAVKPGSLRSFVNAGSGP
ncbi:hypothetical protein [Blastopirellula retiformator]|uniref:hypothetical protein n=1 Tax=Blastopirellula retiformator TaxID=2527970 RepID=UPI0011B43DB9|nr:hypothetical protein [Blastopirellula retiformator]